MQDLANTALNIALQLGATYADVRVMERTVESISVKNGRVEALSSSVESGFNVRVIAHGAWGFASSARLDLAEARIRREPPQARPQAAPLPRLRRRAEIRSEYLRKISAPRRRLLVCKAV